MRLFAILFTAAIGGTSAFADFSGPAPLAWRWQQPTDVSPLGSPVVDGDIVYVASGQRMYALNRADGNQKWRFPVGTPLAANFKGSIAVGDGIVTAPADNRTIYACDATTGKRLWEYISASSIIGAPQITNSFVLFQLADGSVMAVNEKDGTPAYTSPIFLRDGVQGSFNVSKNDVLLFSTTNVLYSINIATQKVEWQRETAGVESDVFPVAFDDSIYFVSNNYLVALSAATGHEQFSTSINESFAFAPAVSKDGIMAVTRSGKAYFFSPTGQQIGAPVDLKSEPQARPGAIPSGLFVIATEGGAIDLLKPQSGIVWSYPIRPIGGVQEVQTRSNQNGLGGKGQGGPGAGGSPGFGGAGGGAAGGAGGQFGNNGANNNPVKVYTVQASGTPVVSGDTLFVLARDGSLLAFDKNNGVDLTPPTVTMTFPNPGDAVSPRPPLALIFKIEDEASGVNENSIKITADGKPLDFEFNREGLLIVRASLNGKNRFRTDGKMLINVDVADWMGNVNHAQFMLNMDDALEPVKYKTDTNQTGPGGKGGKGGGFGGG